MLGSKFSSLRQAKDDEPIHYVIYCRKSSDESSNKQVASIPRQLAECVRYAEREGLTIKEKPESFPFETQEDILKEDTEEDAEVRQLYLDTRHLFIVKEEKTGKTPGARKKWKLLTKMIKQGKVKGLLSYSPDRQARNMVEGGELIDFVDKELIDLRYTNFQFEPNAAGKMMLGIWFVFSKQYSDKLGEDVSAGNSRKLQRGETIGAIKHGYTTGKDRRWIPDGKNFSLLKQAFSMRIYEQKTNEEIADWLDTNGYRHLIKTTGKCQKLSKQKLTYIWPDPFYCGFWIRKEFEEPINLKEIDPAFQPMISEEEHQVLFSRSQSQKKRHKRKSESKDTLWSIRVLDNGFVTDLEGHQYTLSLPNRRKRFGKKLEELKESQPDAKLADVVKPHQIIIGNSTLKRFVSFEAIESEILKKLELVHITDEYYEKYMKYYRENFNNHQQNVAFRKKQLQIQENRLTGERDSYVDGVIKQGRKFDDVEFKAYNKTRAEYDKKIILIRKELEELNKDTDDEVLSMETIMKFFSNVAGYYQKATYVQKREIINILFSNIIIHPNESLEIKVRENLEYLFSRDGRPLRRNFEQLRMCLLKLSDRQNSVIHCAFQDIGFIQQLPC